MFQQLLSDIVTLRPRQASGRDGDVGWAGWVAGVQMERQTHLRSSLSSNGAVNLEQDPILSYEANRLMLQQIHSMNTLWGKMSNNKNKSIV